MIHNSYDYADANSVVKLVPSKTEAYMSISPGKLFHFNDFSFNEQCSKVLFFHSESTYSTNDVFDLPPQIRDCLKDDERQTDTFLRYSYVNCMAECRSAIVNELCGCVPFTLPSNGSYTKCKMAQMKCIRSNYARFSGSMFQMKNDSSESAGIMRAKCHCLPDCTYYAYPSEISAGRFKRDFTYNSVSFFKDTNLTDQSLVHVFFNDLISTHYRKDMYQNWLGVLAAIGGLLGLFLGFSLVTGFELVYFFTIRTMFDKLATRKSQSSLEKWTFKEEESRWPSGKLCWFVVCR